MKERVFYLLYFLKFNDANNEMLAPLFVNLYCHDVGADKGDAQCADTSS